MSSKNLHIILSSSTFAQYYRQVDEYNIWRWMPIREYYIIYRGPGFLMVVWFGSSPPPSPPSPVSKLSLFLSIPVSCRSSILTGGAKLMRPQENLALHKSFNTLWCRLPTMFCKIKTTKLFLKTWKIILPYNHAECNVVFTCFWS